MEGIRLDSVSDWERSDAFYRDVLGAELVSRGEGWTYRSGDARLNLHGPGGEYEANATIPAGGSDLCFERPGRIETAEGLHGLPILRGASVD